MAHLLSFYSWGQAVENKGEGNELIVEALDINVFQDGELYQNPLKEETPKLDARARDADGVMYEDSTVQSKGFPARWLPMGSNRVTAPDVRRGERVKIYRKADSPEFFWKEAGLDEHLRRQETVVWAFNNNPETGGGDEFNPELCYYVELSTHKGHLVIETNQSNSEPVAWSIDLNAKEGVLTIQDSDESYLEYNAVEPSIRLQLNTGTFVTLDKKLIEAYAPELIHLFTDKDIRAEAKNMTFSCERWMATATGNFTVNAGKWHVECPDSSFSGKLKVGKDLIVGGKADITGVCKAEAHI